MFRLVSNRFVFYSAQIASTFRVHSSYFLSKSETLFFPVKKVKCLIRTIATVVCVKFLCSRLCV